MEIILIYFLQMYMEETVLKHNLPLVFIKTFYILFANEVQFFMLKLLDIQSSRLICGAGNTPVTALQLYTENLPISLEIQKQAAATFISNYKLLPRQPG